MNQLATEGPLSPAIKGGDTKVRHEDVRKLRLEESGIAAFLQDQRKQNAGNGREIKRGIMKQDRVRPVHYLECRRSRGLHRSGQEEDKAERVNDHNVKDRESTKCVNRLIKCSLLSHFIGSFTG